MKISKIIIYSLVFCIFFIPTIGFTQNNKNLRKIDILVFYGKGCPHCAKLNSFLEEISKKHKEIEIQKYEVYFNKKNNELFSKLALIFDTEIKGVPTVFIDNKTIVGFSNSIRDTLQQEIERCIKQGCQSPLKKFENDEHQQQEMRIIGKGFTKENPQKKMSARKLTVPAVLIAAIVDAINPCAFAVLVILLTAILSADSNKRALFAGLAFTLSMYISYLLMGMGLFSAIHAAGLAHGFYIFVAILAIFVGLFNLKDYLWYGK
jgi:glutaredoxin